MRCKDISPLIRKQAAKTMGGLLTLEPSSTAARTAWLVGVLPLLRDSEASVSEAARDAVLDLVLMPLARCANKPRDGFDSLAWGLLTRLTPECEPLLQYGVAALAKLQRLPSALAKTAQAMLAPDAAPAGVPPRATRGGAAIADAHNAPLVSTTEQLHSGAHAAGRAALWAVLLQLARQPQGKAAAHRLDPTALAECWRVAAQRLEGGGGAAGNAAEGAPAPLNEAEVEVAFGAAAREGGFALRVLTCLARRSELPESIGETVGKSVLAMLCRLDAPTPLLVPLVQAAAALPAGAGEGAGLAWASGLMTKCEHVLRLPLPVLSEVDLTEAALGGAAPTAHTEALQYVAARLDPIDGLGR